MKAQGDGAFAVVDIVTLWRDLEGEEMRWKGAQGVLEGGPGVEDDHAHRRAGVLVGGR
ncbi:MAG TPA: hypothetical protein VKA82_07870 [Rubrobacter sp.]|nr:hypothetical protein [Rubrobacter sp.]